MDRAVRFALALAAPLLLASCLLSPGRFAATLDIGRDRAFTFTYVGEAVVSQPSPGFNVEGADDDADPDEDAAVAPAEISEADRRRIVEGLAQEEGYRSVEYVGNNTFRIDYSISGRLDRGFVFPINLDAAAVIPWLMVEVRRDGTARVTGVAFGDSESGSGQLGDANPNRQREGSFTLATDAELVMHNNERGATPGERTTVAWQITPTTRSAPTAVVRFAE